MILLWIEVHPGQMALVLTLTKEQTKLFWGEDGGGDYSLLGERGRRLISFGDEEGGRGLGSEGALSGVDSSSSSFEDKNFM